MALESTGVYWIPVYEVLEQRGLTVWLVDARQMKYVPPTQERLQDNGLGATAVLKILSERVMTHGLPRVTCKRCTASVFLPDCLLCICRAIIPSSVGTAQTQKRGRIKKNVHGGGSHVSIRVRDE